MLHPWKWLRVVALAAWGIVGAAGSPSLAQVPPPANKIFRLLPGGDVNAAARQAAMSAQAYGAEDAYRDSFNPYSVSNISGRPRFGYSGPPGFSVDDDGNGGYLSGSALVMDAQGQFLISIQQAMMLQQDVIRERIRNRRRIFDEWLYERANTPTLEQLRQEALALQWSRSRNDPPVTEIYSGRSLNILLNGLLQSQGSSSGARPIRLTDEVLRHVNVISTQEGGNFGLLKTGAKLEWPLALLDLSPEVESTAQRKQVESLVAEALSEAQKGRTDGRLLKGLHGSVETLLALLKKNVHDLSFHEYNEAKRFLDNLNDGIRVLERPDAGKYVTGAYALDAGKIQTVEDLVRFMSEHGLTFAPAVSGDEGAYVAVQRALANYDSTSQPVVAAGVGDQ